MRLFLVISGKDKNTNVFGKHVAICGKSSVDIYNLIIFLPYDKRFIKIS